MATSIIWTMKTDGLTKMKAVLEDSPLVHRVEHNGLYLKIFTEILLGFSDDYLNLYLMDEDDGFFLQDANNIYMELDEIYAINEERLAKVADMVGLTFEDYRFFITVDASNIDEALKKFQKAVDYITTHYY